MNEINIEKLYNLIKNSGNYGSLDSFKSKMKTTEQRRAFFQKFYSELKGKGIGLGKYADFEKRYGSIAPTQTTVNPIIQKLITIDETLKKTTSPDVANYRYGENDDKIQIFWSTGTWRFRMNSVNNKNGEHVGKWYFDGDSNYKIKDETNGEIYDFKTDTWTKPKPSGATWKEVTFTLEDVLAGKAVLKRGMKGKAVEDLQKLMLDMNLSKVSKTGKPDGKYGKLTELSIRQFQGEMKHGEQDGKVGQKTLKRMYYVFNYDPDKEVDDEQPQVPATSDKYSPQGVPDDALKPQTPIDGETSTTPQAVPDTTTQPKKKLTLSPINEQENNEEIVSQKVKSLQLSDIYKGV